MSTFLRLGIVGFPVAHSRSPVMHAAALASAGLSGEYERYEVAPAALAGRLDALQAAGLRGLNVTLPHKTSVLPLLDAIDPAAERIGAVNTIVFEAGRRLGSNTDAPGLVRSLVGVVPRGRVALVLGAGGAARAATVGLADAGAEVWASARREDAARALPEVTRVIPWDALPASLPAVDLLVQATSATMGQGAEAFVEALGVSRLPPHAAVVDLVYTPRRTRLLEVAAGSGLTTIEGLGMLVHQGALSFERWTGVAADVDAMRASLS